MSATKRPHKPLPGRSLAERRPDLAETWNVDLNGGLTAADVGFGSAYAAHWNCTEGHPPFVQMVFNRVAGTGCQRCTRRGSKPLGLLHPWLVDEWHPDLNGDVTPFDISFGSNMKAWWTCPAGHPPYRQMVSNRTRTNTPPVGCPICGRARTNAALREIAAKRTASPGYSVADVYPHIATQLDPERNELTAEQIMPFTKAKLWWICSEDGTSFQRTPKDMANSPRCPDCARRRLARNAAEAHLRPAPGRSIAELRPELAAEWDQDANGELTPFDRGVWSKIPVHWRCPEGHCFTAPPRRRLNSRTGAVSVCPHCRAGEKTGDGRTHGAV